MEYLCTYNDLWVGKYLPNPLNPTRPIRPNLVFFCFFFCKKGLDFFQPVQGEASCRYKKFWVVDTHPTPLEYKLKKKIKKKKKKKNPNLNSFFPFFFLLPLLSFSHLLPPSLVSLYLVCSLLSLYEIGALSILLG
jgi:hypothetical protein